MPKPPLCRRQYCVIVGDSDAECGKNKSTALWQQTTAELCSRNTGLCPDEHLRMKLGSPLEWSQEMRKCKDTAQDMLQKVTSDSQWAELSDAQKLETFNSKDDISMIMMFLTPTEAERQARLRSTAFRDFVKDCDVARGECMPGKVRKSKVSQVKRSVRASPFLASRRVAMTAPSLVLEAHSVALRAIAEHTNRQIGVGSRPRVSQLAQALPVFVGHHPRLLATRDGPPNPQPPPGHRRALSREGLVRRGADRWQHGLCQHTHRSLLFDVRRDSEPARFAVSAATASRDSESGAQEDSFPRRCGGSSLIAGRRGRRHRSSRPRRAPVRARVGHPSGGRRFRSVGGPQLADARRGAFLFASLDAKIAAVVAAKTKHGHRLEAFESQAAARECAFAVLAILIDVPETQCRVAERSLRDVIVPQLPPPSGLGVHGSGARSRTPSTATLELSHLRLLVGIRSLVKT